MTDRGLAPTIVQRGFTGGHLRALSVLVAWLVLISGFQLYAWQQMLTPQELLDALVQLCRTSPAGPLLFIAAAALSPLLLLPAAVLGVVAGICFGPVLGVIITLVGCNLSATITYAAGRLSRGGVAGAGRINRMVERYGPRLRRNAFVAVVVLRLSFLPYDPINYLVGLLRVRWALFIAANTLGSLPGVIALVLAGASVRDIRQGLPMLDPVVLVTIGLLLLSVALAAALRNRASRSTPAPEETLDGR